MDSAATGRLSRRIRVYPTAQQKQTLRLWFEAASWCFNETVARLREPGTRASWKAVRTAIIHSAPARLQAAPYQVKSIAVRDACQAVKNAKLHYKETGEFSQVEFRRRKDPRQGCFIPASAVSQTGIYPTILGPLRMAENIPNDHRDSRLTLSHGQFHLAVPVETQRREAETQGRVVALDPGIRSFLSWFSETDAGHIGQQDFGRIQRLCTHLDNLLGRAARDLHQQKRNMYRAAGRMRTRIRNLVDELHHKAARFLVDHYDIILLPTLRDLGNGAAGRAQAPEEVGQEPPDLRPLPLPAVPPLESVADREDRPAGQRGLHQQDLQLVRRNHPEPRRAAMDNRVGRHQGGTRPQWRPGDIPAGFGRYPCSALRRGVASRALPSVTSGSGHTRINIC
jgi:hypothetical protein